MIKDVDQKNFSDEARLRSIWPQLENLSLAFAKSERIPDLYVFKDDFKIEFPASLSQADRRGILEPANWQFRVWQTAGVCNLNFEQNFKAQKGELYNLAPENNLEASNLVEQFRLAEHLYSKAKWRRGFLQVGFRLPFCLLTFPDKTDLLCWRVDKVKITAEEFSTRAKLLETYEKIFEELMNNQESWTDYLIECRAKWHKPRLGGRHFARAWVPILFRDGELAWRQQLVLSGVRPTNYAFGLNFLKIGQKQKLVLEFLTTNYTWLKPLKKTQQLLAFDDLRLWQSQAVETEFKLMNQSNFLTPLQEEIYLNLLQDRGELKKDWLWPT